VSDIKYACNHSGIVSLILLQMTFQTWQNSVSDHLQSLWALGICVGELEFNLFKQSERLLKGFQGKAIKDPILKCSVPCFSVNYC